MRYAIVFSSQTGNTALLAETIRAVLPQEDCIYFGPPHPKALEADILYVGFWTLKGTCDTALSQFLHALIDQQVFLFGTAGFGASPSYFTEILQRVKDNLDPNVQLIGTYMCQGKMPQSVRTRYESMADSPQKNLLIANFDTALHHPNADDLQQLLDAVQL